MRLFPWSCNSPTWLEHIWRCGKILKTFSKVCWSQYQFVSFAKDDIASFTFPLKTRKIEGRVPFFPWPFQFFPWFKFTHFLKLCQWILHKIYSSHFSTRCGRLFHWHEGSCVVKASMVECRFRYPRSILQSALYRHLIKSWSTSWLILSRQ